MEEGEEEITTKAEDVQGDNDVSEKSEVSKEKEEAQGGCCGGCT